MLTNETAPISKDLAIQKGTTKNYEVRFSKNGATLNITGWTVFFTVKEKMNDTDSEAKISKTVTTHTNGTSGIAVISLSATDTNIIPTSYYYDIVVQDNNAPINRAVILRGRLTIEKTTTRREN